MRKPSVTQLVDMLDKPALLRWANQQGLKGIDIEDARRASKGAGASLHEQIHAEHFVDPIHAEQYARFLKDKSILEREKQIETDWFVGRYDAKLTWRGKTYIVDYKSGSGLYFEQKLQLVAYGMADPCDAFAVVGIPDFVMRDALISSEDRRLYEGILIALSSIYTMRKELQE